MAVRNFWVEANIDGRETELSGGPRNKEGGMVIRLYQRDEGKIEEAIKVTCKANEDGKLVATVYVGGKCAGNFVTNR